MPNIVTWWDHATHHAHGLDFFDFFPSIAHQGLFVDHFSLTFSWMNSYFWSHVSFFRFNGCWLIFLSSENISPTFNFGPKTRYNLILIALNLRAILRYQIKLRHFHLGVPFLISLHIIIIPHRIHLLHISSVHEVLLSYEFLLVLLKSKFGPWLPIFRFYAVKVGWSLVDMGFAFLENDAIGGLHVLFDVKVPFLDDMELGILGVYNLRLVSSDGDVLVRIMIW